MADTAALHHEYLALSASLITKRKEIEAATAALAAQMASFNAERDQAAKILNQLPTDGQDWLQQFCGPLPDAYKAINVPVSATPITVTGTTVTSTPNAHRDSKVDTSKAR